MISYEGDLRTVVAILRDSFSLTSFIIFRGDWNVDIIPM